MGQNMIMQCDEMIKNEMTEDDTMVQNFSIMCTTTRASLYAMLICSLMKSPSIWCGLSDVQDTLVRGTGVDVRGVNGLQ